MDSYILDTNVFFNMEAGFALGKTTNDVMKTITQFALEGKSKQSHTFFMPPRIVDEFLSFFDDTKQDSVQKLLAAVVVQSPEIHTDSIPAHILYTMVEDIRLRSLRGLRVGEEEIEKAGKSLMEKGTLDRISFQKTIGEYVRGYRDRYRQATRVGFLDSVADLDVIMLAKEVNGAIVSSDEGLLKWARLFGVKEVVPQALATRLHQG